MEDRFDLLVLDVMPIYMIIPRYSHNYAQLCQLLNINLFTHRKILMLLREATSETYGPRVYSHHINLHYFIICFVFLPFTFHFASIYQKYQKYYLSSLSDLTFVSDREGIDNPFIALVARILFVCVGARDSCVVSYWIDTLVLKNWEKYLRYCAASPFPLQGKTNASSRGSTNPKVVNG